MQYYYIKVSTERKVIGRKWPQCDPYPYQIGYNWSYAELPNSMTKIPYDKFSKIKPFIIFGLENSSKLTDILSNATIHANGLLISERTKILFDENLNIPNSKYYDAQIYFKGQIYNYYFLHILPYNLGIIDFQDSEFGLYQDILGLTFINNLKFKNKLELAHCYKNRTDMTHVIKCHKLKLVNDNFDILYINELNSIHEFITSEKVVQIIKEHKLTGFEIIQIE